MDIIDGFRDALPQIQVPLIEPIRPPEPEVDVEAALAILLRPNQDLHGTDVAASLQSWLFFGLLAKVLKDRFLMEDFVTQPQGEPGPRVLSLRNLPTRFQESRGGAFRRLWETRYPRYAVDAVVRMDAFGYLNTSPAGETGLAILVLVQALYVLEYSMVQDTRRGSHTRVPRPSCGRRRSSRSA